MINIGKKYDFIIVGAGSAGCLLAKRLTSNPKLKVLLLEAGGKDNYHWIHIPVGYLYCINNPRTDWCYRTVEEPGLNKRSLIYPRGKVVGGCSSINGMIYMRGQKQDYEGWAAETGDQNWNWANVLQRYKGFENYHGGANEWHGSEGEWRVEQQRLRWDILDVFRKAANQAGVPNSDDFNRGDNHGIGYFDVNQTTGWRLNAARAFLYDAEKRENLDVITNAQVKSLKINPLDNTCYGLEYVQGGNTYGVHCDKEVVLSSGSVGSVQILERSGVGNAAHLEKLGLKVKCDLPGVGENLQDHLQLRMIYKINDNVATLNKRQASLFGKAMIGLEYILNRSGPMSMAPSQLGAFAYSDPRHDRANVQYHVQPLSLEKFGDDLHPFNAFTASICNLRPTSRGSIHITSTEMDASPQISPNYLSTEEDKLVAAESLKLTRRIVSSEALNTFEPEEYKPGKEFVTDKELAFAAGNIGTTIFHPVGTCKMGNDDDKMAVLDPRLRVRGVKGLRVADASAMPTITSGNTAAPTMMIAETLSEIMLREYE
jgi:choline dehydrogenase